VRRTGVVALTVAAVRRWTDISRGGNRLKVLHEYRLDEKDEPNRERLQTQWRKVLLSDLHQEWPAVGPKANLATLLDPHVLTERAGTT